MRRPPSTAHILSRRPPSTPHTLSRRPQPTPYPAALRPQHTPDSAALRPQPTPYRAALRPQPTPYRAALRPQPTAYRVHSNLQGVGVRLCGPGLVPRRCQRHLLDAVRTHERQPRSRMFADCGRRQSYTSCSRAANTAASPSVTNPPIRQICPALLSACEARPPIAPTPIPRSAAGRRHRGSIPRVTEGDGRAGCCSAGQAAATPRRGRASKCPPTPRPFRKSSSPTSWRWAGLLLRL